MGHSFAAVVSAEMIAADFRPGYLIFKSRLRMATDKIFIGIVCLGALGLATDRSYVIVRFARSDRVTAAGLVTHRRRDATSGHRNQSSSASRRTASQAGFFDLSQSGERPER